MQNYASLQEIHDQDEQGILVHVAEPTRSKWNHIEDLDSFFTRMYKYHQKHGFMCILLMKIFDLIQHIYVIILATYIFFGIDYSKLLSEHDKLTFGDIVLSPWQVYQNLNRLGYCLVIFGIIFWIFKLLSKIYQTILYWDIKQFYNTALGIDDRELDNITWSEVQSKIKQAQLEQQMCIHKREITELDIYHRILRQENYLIAMVNKKLLPPRIRVPFIGEEVYWTTGLRFTMQVLVFWSPWSLFENPWHLREEYKRPNLRHELAQRLSKHILWWGFINLIFSPIIFVWQLLYTFFSYADMLKREPGRLGIRHWSAYAKLYLRHFNELDHELHARFTRAYRPAAKYLGAFSSPVITLIAQHVSFICGSLFAVIVIFTLIDESFLSIEHILPVMTFLGIALPVCRGFIPDESMVWCPETLLQGVLLHTHYLPPKWKGYAHTSRVKEEFQELFQYRFVALIEEVLSPLLTPYFMWRWLYPRSLDIVDFFRNFTVSVVGVGDVCSFAQMDIKKHGNPEWQIPSDLHESDVAADQYQQAEDGKTELSLMHFTTTNPGWVPPKEAQDFIQSIQEESLPYAYTEDVGAIFSIDNILQSSSLAEFQVRSSVDAKSVRFSFEPDAAIKTSMSRIEGPTLAGSANMRSSVMALHGINHRQQRNNVLPTYPQENTPLLSTRP